MKYVDVLKLMHVLFVVIMVVALVLADYRYLSYIIIVSACIIVGWMLNKECVINEYDRFVECSYDNNDDKCKECNQHDQGFKVHLYIISKYKGWFLSFMIIILICILRIVYQYNFITFTTVASKSIILTLFMVIINLLFFILLIPAIQHYTRYQNVKQLTVYLVFFVTILSLSCYYCFIQSHQY